jgi:hypothetical protein
MLAACGVGGLAEPTHVDPENFFAPIAPASVRFFDLDFDALDRFRADRHQRGFFWKKPR